MDSTAPAVKVEPGRGWCDRCRMKPAFSASGDAGIGRDEMRAIAAFGLVLTLVTGCATPQIVKDASRQQGDLLGDFHKTLGELRSKLLAFYDQEIEEFRQGVLTSRMTLERYRLPERAAQAIRAIDRTLSEAQRTAQVKKVLDGAANYLTQLPEVYFDEKYCVLWETLKPESLREPNERCHDDHAKRYQALRAGRQEVANRFDRLVKAVARTREAHDLVNEFLQIEFRLTRERVDAAKKVIEEARKTVEEAKAAWSKLQAEEGATR